MMTAMIKPSDSNTEIDDFDTAPHTKSNINHPLKHSINTQYKPNIKPKILGPKS